jgi:hypothetical protein
MTAPPDAPDWSAEYPFRDELGEILAVVSAAQGRRGWPEGVTREEAIARAQISGAFRIERLARLFMAGRQFTGVQLDKRGVLVDDAFTARTVADAWRLVPRTPEAQRWIDRAAGCLRQCFEHGMVVLEWDRPGYDDVTKLFFPLLGFASDPSVTPVELRWEPAYLGEPPPDPAVVARVRAAMDAARAQSEREAALGIALVIVGTVLLWMALRWLSRRDTEPSVRAPCACGVMYASPRPEAGAGDPVWLRGSPAAMVLRGAVRALSEPPPTGPFRRLNPALPPPR